MGIIFSLETEMGAILRISQTIISILPCLLNEICVWNYKRFTVNTPEKPIKLGE